MQAGSKNNFLSSKPDRGAYPEFYHGYISSVPEGNVVAFLENQIPDFVSFLRSLQDESMSYSYAPGKWTVAEVIGHIMDVERVMAYRILRFSRNDQTPVPGFEEDDYVRNCNHSTRHKVSFAEEFEVLRQANLFLIKNLSEEQAGFTGVANGGVISVKALIFILAGHLTHHRNILKERYGLG